MSWSNLVKPLGVVLCLLVAVALWGATALRPTAGDGRLPAATPRGSRPDVGTLRNATFELQGKRVTLVDGLSEIEAAPGSASRTVTRYFGSEALGDLDGDGLEDAAFLVTQSSGGSGTFFYVVAARAGAGGYAASNAVLLGDRIAPQSVRVSDRTLVVTYADRAAGEPMTARPSVGVSKTLRLAGGSLVGA